MEVLKRYGAIPVMVIGLAVIAVGGFFVSQGLAAKDEIRARMAEEAVTTKIDGVEVAVLDQETATLQAELIKSHTLGKFGTYGSMERDDPRRAVYIKGLTLRNSLNMARMGLDLGDLVIASGILFGLVGAALSVAGAVVYAAAYPVRKATPAAMADDLHRVPVAGAAG